MASRALLSAKGSGAGTRSVSARPDECRPQPTTRAQAQANSPDSRSNPDDRTPRHEPARQTPSETRNDRTSSTNRPPHPKHTDQPAANPGATGRYSLARAGRPALLNPQRVPHRHHRPSGRPLRRLSHWRHGRRPAYSSAFLGALPCLAETVWGLLITTKSADPPQDYRKACFR